MPDREVDEVFIKKHSKLVYTAVRNRLKKFGFELAHEDILDITQDAFTHIFESGALASIRSPDSIPYWIAIVSGNIAMQYMRRKRRIEPEKVVSIFTKTGDCELVDIIPSCVLNPSQNLSREDLSRNIDTAIDNLPPRERLIIKLNLLHEKRYEEISEMLHIPIGTVSNYIKRAKDKLRRSLKGLV